MGDHDTDIELVSAVHLGGNNLTIPANEGLVDIETDSPHPNEHDSNEQALLLPTSSDRYARRVALSQYFPELDPKHPRWNTLRSRMAKRTTMLTIQLTVALSVTVCNIVITLWALISHSADSIGVGTLMLGNCSTANTLNSTLHIALNIVSSLFLGAVNYCMQVLVAPSRAEIRSAHLDGRTLEIGVPSIKNLWHIERKRALAWLLAGIFVVNLHLFWNSVIFISIPIVSIPRAIATSDFTTAPDNWTASDPLPKHPWWGWAPMWGVSSHNLSSVYSLQSESAKFTHLNTTACIARYIGPLTATSAVVVVGRNLTTLQNNGSSLIDGWYSIWDSWGHSADWICDSYQGPRYRYCNQAWADTFDDEWIIQGPRIGDGPARTNIEVDYCLAGDEGDNEERCGLHYNTYIMVFVSASVMLESTLIFWTWFVHRRQQRDEASRNDSKTMVTLGDAIDGFLEFPRYAMTNRESDISEGSGLASSFEEQIATWEVKANICWFRAVGPLTWIISLSLFVVAMIYSSVTINSALHYLGGIGVSTNFDGLWQQGFKVHPTTVTPDTAYLAGDNGSVFGFPGNVLIVNSPQLVVSFLYLFYNNILTRQIVAAEWTRFQRPTGKKPLRVSSPDGMQRSSYFLTLPLKYSASLMASIVLLHWLVSESIFIVRSTGFGPGANGERLPMYDKTNRGYSPLATILAISLGGALIAVLLAHSVIRRYKDVPLSYVVNSCSSLAISIACQRPAEDIDGRLFPINLGALQDRETESMGIAGRLVVSTDVELKPLQAGSRYLRTVFLKRKETVF